MLLCLSLLRITRIFGKSFLHLSLEGPLLPSAFADLLHAFAETCHFLPCRSHDYVQSRCYSKCCLVPLDHTISGFTVILNQLELTWRPSLATTSANCNNYKGYSLMCLRLAALWKFLALVELISHVWQSDLLGSIST